MTKFLITGGSGFLGQWLTRILLEGDDEVILFDLEEKLRILSDAKKYVKFLRGDITDKESISKALSDNRPDVLVHYASLLSSKAEKDPLKGYKVDIASTWPLFQEACSAGVKTIVFASSVAAYGPSITGEARETMYSNPTTIYGISKIFGEMAGVWFQMKFGVQFLALRYASVVGPGRIDGGASAYSTLSIQRSLQNQHYTVYVDENARMPIVYVKDAVDATLYLLKKRGEARHFVYNVVGPFPSPSALDLVEEIREQVPGAGINFDPSRELSAIVSSWPKDLDPSRLLDAGWKPKYSSLKEMIIDFKTECEARPEVYRID